MSPEAVLRRWLDKRLEPAAAGWLDEQASRVRGGGDRELFLATGLVTRRLGKAPLAPTADELAAAESCRPGWNPVRWSVDEAARVYLLLAAGTDDTERFAQRLDRLCSAGEIGELVAFYQGLPLYPDPPRYVLRAAEGVRSNIRAVFEAVAHRNPYPAEQFPEQAWNQMVLKALFVGTSLAPIVGLERRANPALAGMLRDYAHERWAARRPVSPELWRCVGPFASGETLADFQRLLTKGTELEQQAAALALSASADAGAAAMLESRRELVDLVRGQEINWDGLAERLA